MFFSGARSHIMALNDQTPKNTDLYNVIHPFVHQVLLYRDWQKGVADY